MNEENLVNIANRSTSEQREIAQKGGIASGKSRREKRIIVDTLVNALNMALECPLENHKLKEEAYKFGFADEELNNKAGLAVILLCKAFKGDIKAIDLLIRLMGEYPSNKVEIHPSQYSGIDINIIKSE